MKLSIFILGGIVCLTGCSNPVIRSDIDRRINTSHYRTYRWVSQDDVGLLTLEYPNLDYIVGSVKVTRDPEIEIPLKQYINSDLEKKGFKITQVTQPDFYVTYYTMTHDMGWISTWQGRAPTIAYVPVIMYPDYSREATRKYTPGALVITIYDAKAKRPVWTETIKGAINGSKLNHARIAQGLKDKEAFGSKDFSSR